MFNRVLIPLDGSETAGAILPLLLPLLRAVDAEALLVRIVTERGEFSTVPREEPEARDSIDRMAAALDADGVPARGFIRTGSPAAGILDAAEELQATMIALTTHGRTGLSRWAMGSVAERVIRSSPVPVLVIRSFGDSRSRSASLVRPAVFVPGRILAPVDGSENSMGAMPYVEALARRFEARVTVLLVRDSGREPGAPDPSEPGRRALRRLADAGVTAELLEESGDPALRILEAAERTGAHLIVMATHGRSGPTRWMLGSVTEKVLHASTLPVLVVRSPKLR